MMAARTTAGPSLLALGAVLALTPAAGAQPARYFPASTEIVVTVNVRQILESDLLKGKKEAVDLVKTMVESQLQQNDEAYQYIKELSFDPFRDLDGITTVSEASTDPAKALAIFTGRFDAKKFHKAAERAAKEHGDIVKLTRAGKHHVVEVIPPGDEKAYYVTLVDGKTLLVSQGKATLKDALSRAAQETPAELKKEVRDLLASRDKKASLSFAATGNAVGKLLEASKDPRIAQAAPIIAKLLEKVSGFNGSVTLGNDVQFQLGVGTNDPATAKEFAQQAVFGLLILNAAVAKEAQKNPQLAPALDVVKTLRASAQGNTFILRGHVPAAVIGQGLKDFFNRVQPK
jgi:hypothetical protein